MFSIRKGLWWILLFFKRLIQIIIHERSECLLYFSGVIDGFGTETKSQNKVYVKKCPTNYSYEFSFMI